MRLLFVAAQALFFFPLPHNLFEGKTNVARRYHLQWNKKRSEMSLMWIEHVFLMLGCVIIPFHVFAD